MFGVVLAGVAAAVAGAPLFGFAYADVNHNGVFDDGDRPLANATIVWESSRFATTDARGHYRLDVPRAGIVWLRVPDGYRPGPVWRRVTPKTGFVNLGVAPRPVRGALSFVHATDAHIGTMNGRHVREAFAAAKRANAHFLALTGDIVSHTTRAELVFARRLLRRLGMPVVSVAGNHDWHDGGALYRRYFGPPMYSFDAGGVRFVVLNWMASSAEQLGFVRRDLAHGARPRRVIAFTHGQLTGAFAASLRRLGVTHVFNGHMHDGRIVVRPGLREVTTPSLPMGGSITPAGYRIVTIAAGKVTTRLHTVVNRSVVELVHPRPGGGCAAAGTIDVIAAVELRGASRPVRLAIDGAPARVMHPTGGWTYSLRARLAPGRHRARLRVGAIVRDLSFCTYARTRPPARATDWSQLGAGPQHRGAVAKSFHPPLRTAWARAIGGYAFGGSPVVAGGRVFVPVIESDGEGGGVVALDVHTGRRLWQFRSPASVHNAPAVARGVVVFVTDDGIAHARDARTGAARWTIDLEPAQPEATSWLYAAPAIAGDTMYVGGHRRFVAADLRSGRLEWSLRPRSIYTRVFSVATLTRDAGVVQIGRGAHSVIAFGRATGKVLWTDSTVPSSPVYAPAVARDGIVYYGNGESLLVAARARHHAELWRRKRLYDSKSWAMWFVAAPALAAHTLVYATPRTYVYAVDARSGKRLWKFRGGASVIRPVAYKTRATGFLASPTITGSIVWAGGVDGVLRAHRLRDGAALYSYNVGAPILSQVVAAGGYLLVTSYDGTIRALERDPTAAVNATRRSVRASRRQ